MPKILRILNRFNLGGPVLNAAYLTRYLEPEFETLLIGGPPEPYEGSALLKVTNMGIEPKILPSMGRSVHPLRDLMAYRKISQIIDEYKPDIVHTHASKAGAIGRFAALRKNVKVLVHTFHGHVFHSYFSTFKTNTYVNIERQLARKTSKIIALSKNQQRELSDTFAIAPAEKFHVIPLGFDLTKFRVNYQQRRNDFREKYGVAQDEIVIGIIGRVTPIKNHQLFLQAISRLQQTSNQKIRGFIIGDGEMKEELMQVCHKNQLKYSSPGKKVIKDANIVFTSWIEPIEYAYPGLDIVALCSLNEGTPVSIIEAQASGTPVVAVDVGGVADIVQPGKTALLADKSCPEDFTQKLTQLVESHQLRKEMATHGYKFVASTFHYSRLVKETGRLYSELLSRN